MYDNNPITLLSLPRLPARIDYQGAAILLNFDPVGIRMLVQAGLLKPLGNPLAQEHKYFATKTILRLGDDEKWLSDATRTVKRAWSQKNSARKARKVK